MKKWLKALAVLLALAVLGIVIMMQVAENTDIPKLYFEGNIKGMWEKTDIRNISVTYRDDIREFSGYAELKVQGTSSLDFEKKNYTIKFYSDVSHEEKMPVDMGWGPQNKYCLKANWIDRTHARNVVTAKLVDQMQTKYGLLQEAPCSGAVDGFPVEIYSNGEFLGLYTFNIPKGDWQFAMDEDNPNHIVFAAENYEPACLFEADPSFETWELEVGQENEQTLGKLKELIDFVRFSSDEEFVSEFEAHFDLDAALNYYVMADVGHMKDNRAKNMLLATYDGKKWYPSLYDLDTCWGTNSSGQGLFDYQTHPTELNWSLLWRRMEQLFAPQLAQRYFELRADILSDAHIMEEFEEFRDRIPMLTFAKETIRWTTGVIHLPSELPGYDYDQIRSYLEWIGPVLDEKYTQMLDK